MGVASAALGVGAGLFGSGRKQQKQERTNKQLQGAQAKINEGIARSNRRRIRGGIFGDADVQQGGGVLNPRLG